jgi:hypothetical protein
MQDLSRWTDREKEKKKTATTTDCCCRVGLQLTLISKYYLDFLQHLVTMPEYYLMSGHKLFLPVNFSLISLLFEIAFFELLSTS